MPALESQVVLYDAATLAAGTYTTTPVTVALAPEPTSGDTTQQVWAMVSWDGLSAGDLQVNVYNLPLVESPAVKSAQGLLVASLVDAAQVPTPQTAADGCQMVFVEVVGPQVYVETIVNGAGTPNVTVTLLSTSDITAS